MTQAAFIFSSVPHVFLRLTRYALSDKYLGADSLRLCSVPCRDLPPIYSHRTLLISPEPFKRAFHYHPLAEFRWGGGIFLHLFRAMTGRWRNDRFNPADSRSFDISIRVLRVYLYGPHRFSIDLYLAV